MKVYCIVFEIWPYRKAPPAHKRTGFHWSHNWNYNSQQLIFISEKLLVRGTLVNDFRRALKPFWKTDFRKAQVNGKSLKLSDFWLQPARSFDTDVLRHRARGRKLVAFPVLLKTWLKSKLICFPLRLEPTVVDGSHAWKWCCTKQWSSRTALLSFRAKWLATNTSDSEHSLDVSGLLGNSARQKSLTGSLVYCTALKKRQTKKKTDC